MNPSDSPIQFEFDRPIENSSPLYLLEQGLHHIRHEHFVEGVVLLALVRDKLPAQHAPLAAALDDFTQGHTVYWHAHQELHDASRRFVDADKAQRARLSTIEKLLSALKEDMRQLLSASPSTTQQLHQPVSRQSHEVTQTPSIPASSIEVGLPPALYFSCFGRFEVRRLGKVLTLCSNRNGQAMLRYLVVQSNRAATMDALMDSFWPDDEPDVAHHKLQVAASALRRSLNGDYNRDRGGGYLLSKRQTYQLNPAIPFHSDLDDFLRFYQAGRHGSGSICADLYQRACQLYTGPLLADDLYADWSSLQRGQLSSIYLTMCNTLVEYYLGTYRFDNAMAWATAILKENHCDEAAHRHLMRAYFALGRRNEALLQYQLCQQTLFEELGIEPMPETVKLFHSLLNGEEGNEQ
jgi:DNA-binding SARP family transcriptional activator